MTETSEDATISVTLEIEEPGKPIVKMRVEGPASKNEVMDLIDQILFRAEDRYPRAETTD